MKHKNGYKKQKGLTMEYICGEAGSSKDGCGTTVVVSQLEIYFFETSTRENGRSTKYFYACPECGAENRIPDPGFPVFGKRQTTSE